MRASRCDLGGARYATPCIGPDGMLYIGHDGGGFSAIDPAGRRRVDGGDARRRRHFRGPPGR